MKTKADAVEEIGASITALAHRNDAADDERDYLVERCPAHLEPAIREIPTAGVHLLAAIGDGEVNLVGLAAQSGQLKGTVSKHVQRLVDAGLVERAPVPGNRKEIRLTLTADGRAVEQVHRRMHDEIEDGLRDFLLRYTAAELQTIATVLNDLVNAEKRGVRLLTGTGR